MPKNTPKRWFTVVSVTSNTPPEEWDSETSVDWIRARTPSDAVRHVGENEEDKYPVAVFRGRRKSL